MVNDILVEIRGLLAAAMGSRCVGYYAGNIGIPANAQMPVCIVRRKSNELVERRSTTADYYSCTLSVLVITNIVKSLAVAGLTAGLVPSENKLANIIEEKDTDGAPKLDTVAGVLTKESNLRGTNYQYITNVRTDYEPELNGKDTFAAAEVTFDVKFSITRKL